MVHENDLILTNTKYCFNNTSSFETDISDHYHLIYSMLRTAFEKGESKEVTYHNYKQFQRKDLKSFLRNCNGEYENYKQNFIKVRNTHAPKKVNILKGIINVVTKTGYDRKRLQTTPNDHKPPGNDHKLPQTTSNHQQTTTIKVKPKKIFRIPII